MSVMGSEADIQIGEQDGLSPKSDIAMPTAVRLGSRVDNCKVSNQAPQCLSRVWALKPS
jgi:hypothetical protein